MPVWVCLLTVLMSLWSGMARSAIVVIQDSRYVSQPTVGEIHPSIGESLFNATASGPNSSASQVSYLLPDRLTGYAVVTYSGDGVPGDSVFDVWFDVDTPMHFDLTGSYAASDTAGMAFLADSYGALYALTPQISLSGELLPGTTYRLFIGVKTPPGGTPTGGGFSFSLIAPEPGLTTLILLGVACCLRPRLPRVAPRASR